MNFADELRAAATKLRTLAQSATPGQWTNWYTPHVVDMRRDKASFAVCHADDGSGPSNAAFIATMNPSVALAVADWLDHTASLIEGNKGAIEGVQSSGMALLTARAINGGAS